MGRLFAALVFADFALVIIAFIDCLSVEAEEIRTLPRAAWAFIILLFPPIGPIAWFMYGRPAPALVSRRVGAHPDDAWRAGGVVWDEPPQREQVPPDDDPEFLRQLSGRPPRAPQDDVDLLRAWEADLRRREEELRRKQRRRGEDPPAEAG
jgi:hypothetical protein